MNDNVPQSVFRERPDIIDQSISGEDLVARLREIDDADSPAKEALLGEVERRIAAFDLQPALIDLSTREPFLSSVCRRVSKVRTNKVPTAAVTAGADTFVMMWNPGFFFRIAPDWNICGDPHRLKIVGVLMHELYHIMLEHVVVRSEGMKYPMLANWAMDLAINCMIPRDHLPEGLLIPGEPLSIPDDAESVYRPDELEQYKQLSAFIASLTVHQSAEYYYSTLIDFIEKNHPNMLADPDWGKPIDQRGSSGMGGGDGDGDGGRTSSSGQDAPSDGQNQGQGSARGAGQSNGDVPDSVKRGYGRLGNFDNHTTWQHKPSKNEQEYISQRIKDIVSAAIADADNAGQSKNGWGSVPAEMQALLRKLVSRQVNWRAILRQFVGNMQRIDRRSTMTRINRRYAYVAPGTKKGRGATLHIYIDQSGSVDDESIALLFNELDNLAKKVSFRVFFFDTEVDENYIEWRRGTKHPAARRRCGGTDFEAATQHANKHAAEHDGFIIMSDGECSKPSASVKRRGWIIVPGRKLMFETHETVVQMTKGQKNNVT